MSGSRYQSLVIKLDGRPGDEPETDNYTGGLLTTRLVFKALSLGHVAAHFVP